MEAGRSIHQNKGSHARPTAASISSFSSSSNRRISSSAESADPLELSTEFSVEGGREGTRREESGGGERRRPVVLPSPPRPRYDDQEEEERGGSGSTPGLSARRLNEKGGEVPSPPPPPSSRQHGERKQQPLSSSSSFGFLSTSQEAATTITNNHNYHLQQQQPKEQGYRDHEVGGEEEEGRGGGGGYFFSSSPPPPPSPPPPRPPPHRPLASSFSLTPERKEDRLSARQTTTAAAAAAAGAAAAGAGAAASATATAPPPPPPSSCTRDRGREGGRAGGREGGMFEGGGGGGGGSRGGEGGGMMGIDLLHGAGKKGLREAEPTLTAAAEEEEEGEERTEEGGREGGGEGEEELYEVVVPEKKAERERLREAVGEDGVEVDERRERETRLSAPPQQELQQQQQLVPGIQERAPTRAGAAGHVEGAYDPEEYAYMLPSLPLDVREVLAFVTRYHPHDCELETPLKCFIPDLLPAVGDMDSFLKMPRPDGMTDELGRKVVDEPAPRQSDPTILELHLAALSKIRGNQAEKVVQVRGIYDAANRPQEVDRWVESVSSLHRSLPPTLVTYPKPMPDLARLMETWPASVQAAVAGAKEKSIAGADPAPAAQLLPPSLDLSLQEYIKTACALFGIPVYENGLLESLHALFTLFLALKEREQPSVFPEGERKEGRREGMEEARRAVN